MKGFVPGRMVAVGMERSMWTCGNLGVDWVMRQEHANENSQILECNMVNRTTALRVPSSLVIQENLLLRPSDYSRLILPFRVGGPRINLSPLM